MMVGKAYSNSVKKLVTLGPWSESRQQTGSGVGLEGLIFFPLSPPPPTGPFPSARLHQFLRFHKLPKEFHQLGSKCPNMSLWVIIPTKTITDMNQLGCSKEWGCCSGVDVC